MKIKMCQLLSSVKEVLLMGKREISKIKYKMVKCMNNMRFFLINCYKYLYVMIELLTNFDNFSCQVEGVKDSSMVKQTHLLKEARQVMQLPLPGTYQMKT